VNNPNLYLSSDGFCHNTDSLEPIAICFFSWFTAGSVKSNAPPMKSFWRVSGVDSKIGKFVGHVIDQICERDVVGGRDLSSVN